MILEPNVPKSVRNWAACRVRIRKAERLIEQLSAGHPNTYRQFCSLKVLRRKEFTTQVAIPELRRLGKRVRRYRAIAEAIEAQGGDPGKYLLSQREMLELIGSTLHFITSRHKEIFLTLQYCSPDGKRLFFKGDSGENIMPSDFNNIGGIDALDLLSFGFGRA